MFFMKPDKSRKQLVIDALMKHRKAMTLDQLSNQTGILPIHIQQAVSSYDSPVVRVREKTYDHISHFYPGRLFRFSPTDEELRLGIAYCKGGLEFFFSAWQTNPSSITIQFNEHLYILKRVCKAKEENSYFSGLKKLYTDLRLHPGDDVLFTCVDITTFTFSVSCDRLEKRDALKISIKNRLLADMVEDILKHSYSHAELEMFLVRRYLFTYPFDQPTPPDSLYKAIVKDPRFIFTPRDRISLQDGRVITGDIENMIGLKKYFFHTADGRDILVSIQTDEEFGGKYGWCTECWGRMVWEKNIGWRHANDECEIEEVPKEFWNFTELHTHIH